MNAYHGSGNPTGVNKLGIVPRVVLLALAVFVCGKTSALADPPSATTEFTRANLDASRSSRRLLHLLGRARVSNNPRQVECVDSQLTVVNSFARRIRSRGTLYRAARARGDRAEALRQRTLLRALTRQLRSAYRRGLACSVDHDPSAATRVIVIATPDVPRYRPPAVQLDDPFGRERVRLR